VGAEGSQGRIGSPPLELCGGSVFLPIFFHSYRTVRGPTSGPLRAGSPIAPLSTTPFSYPPIAPSCGALFSTEAITSVVITSVAIS
jgi:hypothetical protein